MNNLDMKNIIVLKEIPSNIVDEAIVILKDNKTKKRESACKPDDEIYLIDEAQNIIMDYVRKIEDSKKDKMIVNKIEVKYKKLKIINAVIVGLLIFSIFI